MGLSLRACSITIPECFETPIHHYAQRNAVIVIVLVSSVVSVSAVNLCHFTVGKF